MKNLKKIVLLGFMFLMVGCSKDQAKEIAGVWAVNQCDGYNEVNGELLLDERGDGEISIYNVINDNKYLLYHQKIEDLHYSHDKRKGWFFEYTHWYQGYFNDDIYFSFENINS